MTLKKRGLGRGLEALLAEDSSKEEKYPSHTPQASEYPPVKNTEQDETQLVSVIALFKNIQKENLILQEEAEALRKLIEEFELMVRADLS